jgi:hypothetical protein
MVGQGIGTPSPSTRISTPFCRPDASSAAASRVSEATVTTLTLPTGGGGGGATCANLISLNFGRRWG